MRRRNPIEWAVLALSALAILVLVGLLVYDGTTREGLPRLIVSLDPPLTGEGGFTVPLRVENRGEVAAASVEVEVVLRVEGREVDAGSVTVAFVPEGSEVDAAVVLGEDPARGRVEGRVLGYELP